MQRHVIVRSIAISLAVAGFSTVLAKPSIAQEWEFDAALYAWLSGVDGTIGVGRAGDQPVEASFSDLAGFLDFAAAGHVEAHNGRFSIITDVNYVGLGSDRDAEIGGQPVSVAMDFDQWIVELSGGYGITPEFDVILAGRYYFQDLGDTAYLINDDTRREDSESWGDVFVGGRYKTLLGNRWVVSVRADVGIGGSDFAWFGNAFVGYRLSDLMTLGLAYRVLSLDYETGSGADYYKYDTITSGLGLGLAFTF